MPSPRHKWTNGSIERNSRELNGLLAITSYVTIGLAWWVLPPLQPQLAYKELQVEEVRICDARGPVLASHHLQVFNEVMVASPGGKIGPVYELGQRFSVGELCYVRQLFWHLCTRT